MALLSLKKIFFDIFTFWQFIRQYPKISYTNSLTQLIKNSFNQLNRKILNYKLKSTQILKGRCHIKIQATTTENFNKIKLKNLSSRTQRLFPSSDNKFRMWIAIKKVLIAKFGKNKTTHSIFPVSKRKDSILLWETRLCIKLSRISNPIFADKSLS